MSARWEAYRDDFDYGKWWLESPRGWKTSAQQNWAIRVLPSDDGRRARAYADALTRVDRNLDSPVPLWAPVWFWFSSNEPGLGLALVVLAAVLLYTCA